MTAITPPSKRALFSAAAVMTTITTEYTGSVTIGRTRSATASAVKTAVITTPATRTRLLHADPRIHGASLSENHLARIEGAHHAARARRVRSKTARSGCARGAGACAAQPRGSAGHRTVTTGTGDARTTSAATLPRKKRPSPLRPW